MPAQAHVVARAELERDHDPRAALLAADLLAPDPRLEPPRLAEATRDAIHALPQARPIEHRAGAEAELAGQIEARRRRVALVEVADDPQGLALHDVRHQHLARRIVGVAQAQRHARVGVAALGVRVGHPARQRGEVLALERAARAEAERLHDLVVAHHRAAAHVDPRDHDARHEVHDQRDAGPLGHRVDLHVGPAPAREEALGGRAQELSRQARAERDADVARARRAGGLPGDPHRLDRPAHQRRGELRARQRGEREERDDEETGGDPHSNSSRTPQSTPRLPNELPDVLL